MDASPTSLAQAAAWQTGTALVQAACSVSLLAWYVLAAHLDRRRLRLEQAEDFDSLVRLCRDLGAEAKDKTAARQAMLAGAAAGDALDAQAQLGLWRSDMQVIYVCLNEVPHYEVRNPEFSTALTRLWLEVDGRSVGPAATADIPQLAAFLSRKSETIGREVDAMASMLGRKGGDRGAGRGRLASHAGRRGHTYSPAGFVESAPESKLSVSIQ